MSPTHVVDHVLTWGSPSQVDESLLVYGGLDTEGRVNAEVWILDLSSWAWHKVDRKCHRRVVIVPKQVSPSITLPPVFGHAMAVYHGSIYSFGGSYGDGGDDEESSELYKITLESGNTAAVDLEVPGSIRAPCILQVTICDTNNSTAPCQRRFHSMDMIGDRSHLSTSHSIATTSFRLYVLAGVSAPSSARSADLYV